jgi:hypothetical protein
VIWEEGHLFSKGICALLFGGLKEARELFLQLMIFNCLQLKITFMAKWLVGGGIS